MHVASILSIFISLIIQFHRGNLVTVLLLSIIYFAFFSKRPSQAFGRMLGFALVICVAYFSFGGILRQKGYDPIDKLSEIVTFTMDVDNPDWDKGRSIPQDYALNAWKENIWFGVGYNVLYHYGLPVDMGAVHNFVIASLFYRGIIGTIIYLLILIILIANSIKFLKQINKEEGYQNDILKLLIIVSLFWFIPFWTQDIIWEKYSLSIQFMFLGIITNVYSQKMSAFTANPVPEPELV
ncbi:MAG TPA: O-antigen ligase family protein [Segetibacter sp.]